MLNALFIDNLMLFFGSVGRVALEEVVELMKKMSSNFILCNRSLSPERRIN